MKLLNLDELVRVERQVTLDGTTYDIADQTIGQMIEALNQASEIDELDEDNANQAFSIMLRTAQRLIPACPTETLKGLNLNQVTALVEFASASDKEVVQTAEVEVEDGEEGPELAEKT